MIDFPLDLAVNSAIMAVVVGTLLLLPPAWLLTPTRRQGLMMGALMGLASATAVFWGPLSGVTQAAGLRPAYLTITVFLLGRRIGLIALLPPLLLTLALRLPHSGEHLLLTVLLMAWADACRLLLQRESGRLSPRVRLWLALLLLSIGVQALMFMAQALGWVEERTHAHLWRYAGSTLLLGCCVDLMLGRARYETLLQRRENELLQVLDSAGGGRWIWDIAKQHTTFQGRFYAQFELTTPPGVDPWQTWHALWHPADAQRLRHTREALSRRADDDFETEFRVRDREGRWHWVLARGRVVERDEQGQPTRMVGMHHDITAAHRANDALYLSQTKFQTIYEALPDAAGITRISDGRYLEVNPAFCRLVGRTRQEILGHTSLELSVWATPEERLKLLNRFREKGLVDSLPLLARGANGQTIPGRMSARQINMEGEPCFIFLFHDTSEHQFMQDQLVRVNALLQQAGRIARLGVWEDSPEPSERYWSEVCYELHGLPPDSPVPEHYVDCFVAEPYRELFRSAMRRAVTQGQSFEHEIQVQRADGRLIWVQAMGEPVRQDGQVRRVRGVIRDIDEARRSLDRLRASEERFARIFNAIPDPMGICSKQDSHYLEVNPAWEQAMGISRAEALAAPSVSALGLYAEADRQALIERAHQEGTLSAYEVDFLPRDGQRHTGLQSMQSIEFDGQGCWLFSIKDITERKQAERLVQEREALLSLTIEAAALALWDVNLQSGEVSGDRQWRELLGLPAASVPHQTESWNSIVHPEDREAAHEALARHQAHPEQPFDLTMRLLHSSGQVRWVRNLGRVIARQPDGRPLRMVGVGMDVTRQREQENQLQKLAHFDALTGLPNRVQLAQALDRAMQEAREHNSLLGVAYLDLDGFKPVNDRFGHGVGDRLLIEVARRLQAAIRPQDLVARLGGDEFVILLNQPSCPRECHAMLEQLMQRLAEPVPLEGESLSVTASTGLTLYPEDDADADTLLRHADQAMYLAKQAGRNRIQRFDAERERASREHHSLLDRLAAALQAGEFCLHVQPKVDMQEGRLVGVEALARWQHPERGLLGPGEFLPQIEGSTLEAPFGEWVLEHSLQLQQRWLAQGLRVPLSLNISARHLQTGDFPQRVHQLLARYPGVPTTLLEIEITESAALTDIQAVSATLVQLRNMGLSIAIDDFGTGYSSLTYLRQLPADTLKIDRSFVHGMMSDIGDMAIVDGVIGLSRSFGLSLIAEGVETTEQGLRLLQMGCVLAQGYGIARPMPAEALRDWAQDWRAPAAWTQGLEKP